MSSYAPFKDSVITGNQCSYHYVTNVTNIRTVVLTNVKYLMFSQ